jgi:hypothetical protein
MTRHRQQRTKPNPNKKNVAERKTTSEATVYRAAILRGAASGIFRTIIAWILEH